MKQQLFNLSKEEATQIKQWRTVDGASWRVIAALAWEKYPDKEIIHGHQIYGMELCKEAALILGEDPNDENWN